MTVMPAPAVAATVPAAGDASEPVAVPAPSVGEGGAASASVAAVGPSDAAGASPADSSVAATDATSPDPTLQAALPVAGETGELLADPAAHLQEALATGTDASDAATSWFCTSTRDGRFVTRTRWHLWEDGLGQVGEDELTWSAADGELVLLTAAGARIAYSAVSVIDRFHRADGFSARLGTDRRVECELAGPPRSNGLFADDGGSEPLTTEEITGEGIDELLVTGRSASDTESFWSCTSSTGGVPVRSFDLRLFDTGEAYSGAPGNWATLDRSTLLLSFEGNAGGSTLIWEDVVIPYRPDQAFDRFVAADANDVDVACRWAGRSRT